MPASIEIRRLAALLAAVAALGAAALFARSTSPAGAASTTTAVHLRANAQGKLRFSRAKIVVAHAGRVSISMVNPGTSGKPHAIAIEGHGLDKDGKIVQPGSTSRVSVRLRKGTYEFYCPVGSHKAAGMKGKLIVR